MLSYSEVMTKLDEMKGHFDSGFSSSEMDFLDKLSQAINGKIVTRTGCQNCYRDAYIIMYNKLKKDKTMLTPTNYRLKAGILIRIFAGPSYAQYVPDEVAEGYLNAHPERVNEFQEIPEDWQKRVAKYAKAQEAKAKSEEAEAKAEEKKAKKSKSKAKTEEAEAPVEETQAEAEAPAEETQAETKE